MSGEFNTGKLSSLLITLMIVGTSFVGFETGLIQVLGKLTIALVFVLAFLLNLHFLKEGTTSLMLSKDQFYLFLPLILWLVTYIYSLHISHGFLDLYIVAELFLIISFLTLMYNLGGELQPNKWMVYLIFLIVGLNFIFIVVQSGGNILLPSRASGLFNHRNTLATTIFYMLGMYILYNSRLGKKVSLLGMFLFVIIIYLANSRAVYGALLVFGGMYCLWPIITRHRVLYYSALYSFVVISILFVGLLGGAFEDIFPETKLLDAYFRVYTGGSLTSGRQELWPSILEQIENRPWLGYGPAHMPSVFMDTGWSAHNYYLQIVLQTGFVGLLMFLTFMTISWSMFLKFKNDKYIRLVASFVISILFHQIFVVSLTQNNMEQAVYFWFILGLGLNRVKTLKNNDKFEGRLFTLS